MLHKFLRFATEDREKTFGAFYFPWIHDFECAHEHGQGNRTFFFLSKSKPQLIKIKLEWTFRGVIQGGAK